MLELHLALIDKSQVDKRLILGGYIRNKRENKGLLLRQVAAFLEVDTAFLSKLERGEKKANKEQVQRLADFLEVDRDELLTLWLTEKLLDVVNNEQQAEAALKLALKEHKKK